MPLFTRDIYAGPLPKPRRSIPFHISCSLFALIISGTSAFHATHADPYASWHLVMAPLALIFAVLHARIAYRAYLRRTLP